MYSLICPNLVETLGVSERTEIIPFEPDAVNADEGKSSAADLHLPISLIMKCFINGEGVELQSSSKVIDVLKSKSISLDGIAVAINETVIPKTKWASTRINNQDNILIITASQGG